MDGIKPKILADRREPDAICDSLESMGGEVEISQLELGDFILSSRLVAERKTRSDFESSVFDGRLFSQLSDLVQNYERVVLIVEGDAPDESRLTKPALLGAYSSVISDFGCGIFFTKSPYATAEMLYAFARHEQVAKKRPMPVKAKRKALCFSDQQRAIIESLPNVGPSLAKSLLDYFYTVENVMTAPVGELCEVDKIGEKKAKELRKVITSLYKPKNYDK